MAQLSKALELYYNNNNSYPTSCANGVVLGCDAANELLSYIPSITSFKDPVGDPDPCLSDASNDPCNYAFSGVSSTNYAVYFMLERASTSTGKRCNKVSPVGTEMCGAGYP